MISRSIGTIWYWLLSARASLKIKLYLTTGRKPWTPGYSQYKGKLLRSILRDPELLDLFRHNKTIPAKYGFRLDERVIEYPWVLSRLGVKNHLLLDAGSALNFPYILDHPLMKSRSVVIYNLSPESVLKRSNISYIYGDLRHAILKSECFDEIVCISTLEHVGMNNTFLYSNDSRLNELKPNDYLDVVRELKRMLKPGGRLFITVPYGRYENLRWLQQFDKQRIESLFEVFGKQPGDIAYYKYKDDGWQIAGSEGCADSSYFDIHNRSDYEVDYVAAARSVACIELIK